jgi:uncharacterized protein YndB with AHSA1/START domain
VSTSATPFEPYDATPGAVRADVEIAATPEQVFDALTDPEQLAEWWGSDDTHRARDWEADVRPGGRFRARTTDADGREGTLAGEYRVVDPPRVLEHTWEPSWDAAPTVVRYDLVPVPVDGRPGTRLTVTHTGFPVTTALAVGGTALRTRAIPLRVQCALALAA